MALFLLTAAVYAPSLLVPIHDWDDNIYFFRDTRVEHLTPDNVGKIFTEPFFSNYHPVTTLTIALDRAIWGTWVPGFHLTHLFFYAGGVLGVYFLFARILRRRAPAFFGAALYASHTVHVESVAWLASRKDVVCLFFYVASLLAYVRYAEAPAARVETPAARADAPAARAEAPAARADAPTARVRDYVIALVTAAAAMLSKGYAVILPGVFLAYDACFAPRITRGRLLDKAPFVLLAAATTFLTVHAQDKQSALVNVALTAGDRVMRLAEVFALYVGHALLPIRLSAIYTTGLTPPKPYLSLLGLLLAAAPILGFSSWRRGRPAAAFGLALFALPLATVMNVVTTLRIWMTDRYLLFPTIGSSLFLVAVASAAVPAFRREPGRAAGGSRRANPRWLAWAAACVVLLYSALTVARIGVWTSGLNLWSDVLRRQLDLAGSGPVTAADISQAGVGLADPGPLVSLRRAYTAKGNEAEAARLDSLIASMGGQAAPSDEHTKMRQARLDMSAGRYADALEKLRPVSEGKTWFAPLAMFRIGVAEEKLGQAERSRQALSRALEMYREWNQPATDAYFEAGTLEYLAGNYPRAAEWYREACRASPAEADPVFHLGLALQMGGKPADATVLYQRILGGELRFKPTSQMTLSDVDLQMATASETLGKREDAIRYFEEALRRNPDYPKRDAILARIAKLRGGKA